MEIACAKFHSSLSTSFLKNYLKGSDVCLINSEFVTLFDSLPHNCVIADSLMESVHGAGNSGCLQLAFHLSVLIVALYNSA